MHVDIFSKSFGPAMMWVQNMTKNFMMCPVYFIEMYLRPTLFVTEIVIEKSTGTF
jgi:hypothetical protein